MVYVPTLIGEIGAFVFNICMLVLLIKYNNGILEYNRKHPIKKKEVERTGIFLYFAVWVAVSIYAWYVMHFIQLGSFFAFCVVLPCVIVLALEWLQVIR